MSRPSGLLVAWSIVSLLAAGTASAQILEIAGPYGNVKGCLFEAGETVSGDDLFVLRPDGFEAYAGACDFVQVLPAPSGARVITALCQSEGMYDIRMFTVSAPDPENSSLLVFFSDGQLWHEVGPCS